MQKILSKRDPEVSSSAGEILANQFSCSREEYLLMESILKKPAADGKSCGESCFVQPGDDGADCYVAAIKHDSLSRVIAMIDDEIMQQNGQISSRMLMLMHLMDVLKAAQKSRINEMRTGSPLKKTE